MGSKPTLLVSNPPSNHGENNLLPYIYGLLKTYCESDSDLSGKFEWLDPDRRFRTDTESLLSRHPHVDVAAFSTYLWNQGLNLATARELKKRNPKTLTVFGGPQMDQSDPDIFRKFPYIDVVVTGEAETVFPAIMKAYLRGEDYSTIPGLFVNRDGERLVTGKAPKLDLVVDYKSVYGVLGEELARMQADVKYNVVFWETSRGCPFSCSYCDWGSYTMSRVRKIPDEILEKEIEWFSLNRVALVVILDANFGIVPRDLELADRLIEAKNRTGYPKSVIYLTSKNTVERNLELVRKLTAAGMMRRKLRFDVQSTDPQVLKNVSRQNISLDKLKQQILEARSISSTASSLILGLPGDSFEVSAKSITDLFEMGIHEDVIVIPWSLLPNSPAANPDYVRFHRIDYIERPLDYTYRNPEHMKIVGDDRLVVGTSSYDRNEWKEMLIFAHFIRTVHCAGLTRFIAIYLRREKALSYLDFYRFLWISFFKETPEYRRMQEKLDAFLGGEKTMKMEVGNELYDLDEWLLSQILADLDGFYKSLTAALDPDPRLANLIEFQKRMISTHESPEDEVHLLSYAWKSYFGEGKSIDGPGKYPHRFRHQKSRPKDLIGYVHRGIDYEKRSNLHQTDRLLARAEIELESQRFDVI